MESKTLATIEGYSAASLQISLVLCAVGAAAYGGTVKRSGAQTSPGSTRSRLGERDRRRAIARIALYVACAAGLVHGASSLYWAFGGRWLLPTVGEWAVAVVETSPLQAGALLGVIGIIKVAAAVIPVGVEFGRIRWARFWRVVCWVSGLFLIAYGGLNAIVSGAVLAGLTRPDGGYDIEAMIGHALLWDPLFFAWGVALVTWLGLTRRRRGAD